MPCRIALHLLKENQTEFLRRMCVICLEDGMLHPELPLLTWLMLASSKGFTLRTGHAEACLGIVSDLAAVPVKDHLRQVFPTSSPSALLGSLPLLLILRPADNVSMPEPAMPSFQTLRLLLSKIPCDKSSQYCSQEPDCALCPHFPT